MLEIGNAKARLFSVTHITGQADAVTVRDAHQGRVSCHCLRKSSNGSKVQKRKR